MGMKTRLLSLLFLVFSICGYAQVKMTVQGGVGKASDCSFKVGYRLGVGVEFPLNSQWSLQTGLQAVDRHYDTDKFSSSIQTDENGHIVSYLGVGIDESVNAVYLSVPIKAVLTMPVSRQSALCFNGGAYVAYGIAGRIKSTIHSCYEASFTANEVESFAVTSNSTIDTFSDKGLKRLDMGLSMGIDYFYKNIFVGIGLEYGLFQTNKEFTDDFLTMKYVNTSITYPRNMGLELHVGYSFAL